MTTFEIVRDFILLCLGVFGTVLSIFNYVQAERRDKRLLLVNMGTAIPTYFDGSMGAPYAKIEATNIGHRAVTVTGIGIQLPDGSTFARIVSDPFPGVRDTSFPSTLDDGKTAQVHYGYADLGAALFQSGRRDKIKLTPFADDSSGTRHVGKPWEVTASELISVAERTMSEE